MHAPTYYYYNTRFLEQYIDFDGALGVVLKTAADLTLWNSFFIATFLFYDSYMRNSNPIKAFKNVKDNINGLMISSLVWIPVKFLQFCVFSLHVGVMFSISVGLIWGIFMQIYQTVPAKKIKSE